MKKFSLVSLSLIAALGASISVASAVSAIYTDDLGRMHFLGKDPSIYLHDSKFENIETPEKKEFNDIIYKNETPATEGETKVNTTEPAAEGAIAPVNQTKTEHTNKSKGSFTFNKGAMDASDPYTFGETNIPAKAKEEKTQTQKTEKKHFWDNW